MKFFVALLCLGAAVAHPVGWAHGHWGGAPLGHDGNVIDTPEVAHAKSAHFAAKAAASHGAHWDGHDWAGHAGWYNGAWNNGHWDGAWNGWHGAPAHVALTHDAQYLRDTPAVSHAKAAHAVAHASAAHRDWSHDDGAHWGWNGHGYAGAYGHHW